MSREIFLLRLGAGTIFISASSLTPSTCALDERVLLLRLGVRFCFVAASGEAVFHPWGSILRSRRCPSVLETGKRDGLQSCQPWSYRRLVAYSFLGLSEGA